MASQAQLVKKNMTDSTLGVIVLNVGDGDAIIIKFPWKGSTDRACAVVDCYNADKTISALKKLNPKTIPFICATHPHYDHTSGMRKLVSWCLDNNIEIKQFWDSGFRHVSKTHYNLIRLLQAKPEIDLVFPTSGFERIINGVSVKVLSPSIHLKNRYDTFGTNINNASIVLKLEYPPKDIAPFYLDRDTASDKDLAEEQRIAQNTMILAGDAQFDAWARITDEFPALERTKNRARMIDPDVIKHRPLYCQVLKVPHHMSKHGISLEVLETLRPRYTIASCANKSNHGFPHKLTVMSVEDIHKDKKDKGIRFTGHRDEEERMGTVVTVMKGGKTRPLLYCLGEAVSKPAPL